MNIIIFFKYLFNALFALKKIENTLNLNISNSVPDKNDVYKLHLLYSEFCLVQLFLFN